MSAFNLIILVSMYKNPIVIFYVQVCSSKSTLQARTSEHCTYVIGDMVL
jgi:hypothetical protein